MTYLEKLRALELEKGGTPAPTKPTEAPSVPTKAPSVGSVGTPPTPVLNIEAGSADDSDSARFSSHARPSANDDPAVEARRQRVLAMLADRQSVRYAVLTDAEAESDAVILALAIRGVGTCELRVPREKYDPFLLLDLIARHGAAIH